MLKKYIQHNNLNVTLSDTNTGISTLFGCQSRRVGGGFLEYYIKKSLSKMNYCSITK